MRRYSQYSNYKDDVTYLPPPSQYDNRQQSLKETIQEIKYQADAASSNIPEYVPLLLDAAIGVQHLNEVSANYYTQQTPLKEYSANTDVFQQMLDNKQQQRDSFRSSITGSESNINNVNYRFSQHNINGANNNNNVQFLNINQRFDTQSSTYKPPRSTTSLSGVHEINKIIQQNQVPSQAFQQQAIPYSVETNNYGPSAPSSFIENPQIKIDYNSVEETIRRADRAINASSKQNVPPSSYTLPIISAPPQSLNVISNPQVPSYQTSTTNILHPSISPLPITSNYNQYSSSLQAPHSATSQNHQVANQLKVDLFSTKWQDIIARGERDGNEFSDSEFLPSPAAIGGSYSDTVVWLRPRQFMREAYSVFERNIDPTSIVPGDLGDSYFRGTLSALAERDYSILKLFLTKKTNKAGCYVLNICWKGVWTPVILDDKFPVKNQKDVCFTKSSNHELWVMILEKAWAKLHGSYAKIDGGLVREVLHDLTGAPARNFFISGEKSIQKGETWQRIQHAEDKNLVALACCMDDNLSEKQQQIAKSYGINNSHPYTVLGTITISDNSVDHKYVKLRNASCKKEWQKGSQDLFFKSLSPQLIHKLRYGGRDVLEGFFLMEFEDFTQFFTDLQIGYQYEGFQYTGEKSCSMRGESNFFKVEISKQGFYFFSVSQQSIRTEPISKQLRLTEKEYYSTAYLAVASEQHPTEFIVAVSGNQRDLTSYHLLDTPTHLTPGKYFVGVKIDWKNQKSSTDNFGVGVFGSSYVDIRASSSQQYPEFAHSFQSSHISWEKI